MKIDINVVNPIEYKDWDQLLLSTKQYSFFHSSAWAKVLSDSYNYSPQYLFSLQENKINLLIPFMNISNYLTGKRGVCLPFTDYCDPIINCDIRKDDIFPYIIEYAKKSRWKYLEIRGSDFLFSNIKPSTYFYGHTLSLSEDEDQLFSKFSKNTKRNIKKALGEIDLKIILSNSLESMKEYFNLHCITRKRHSLPPQPFYFFKNIYEHILSKNLGFVVLASYKNVVVGGAVYFHFGDKAIYKYGASNLDYKEIRPNNLIMWEAIKWYSQNGYKHFCLGRTDPENSGLRRFKTGWGTEEKVINYYKYDLKSNTFVSDMGLVSNKQSQLFKKMPRSLLKIIGNKFYKYVG
jgi:hypothetical protein